MQQPEQFRILFLCKKDNVYAQQAAAFISKQFPLALVFEGTRFDPLPSEVLNWKGDLLISFISSWLLPASLLESASFAAINFHPGSPEYPGTGCTNFAIYKGEREYGVTVHEMKAAVDSGNIIAVKRFPVLEHDTVYSVTQHCYQLLEELFYEIMNGLLHGKGLPSSTERWARKPYTRKELNELCEITAGMSEEEMERRIKATTYREPWAFTRIGKRIFKLQS